MDLQSPHASLMSAVNHTLQRVLRRWPKLRRSQALVRALRRPQQVTLLVSDLVDFSRVVTTLGDRAAHQLIQLHNTVLRACLHQHGGREITHTGDGMIASFVSANAAASCAIQVQRRFRELRQSPVRPPLRLRIGIHAGRPIPEEGRLFGSCVNFAVRVCAAAAPEEILLSSYVQSLLVDSVACTRRAPVPLKGFEGEHTLHAVHWQAPEAPQTRAPVVANLSLHA
jgi:class 3 adenylate cyclase